MRLEQIVPPELVAVEGAGAALLIARRGRRCYVQVSRGAGLNHLRWVDASLIVEPGSAAPGAAAADAAIARRPPHDAQ